MLGCFIFVQCVRPFVFIFVTQQLSFNNSSLKHILFCLPHTLSFGSVYFRLYVGLFSFTYYYTYVGLNLSFDVLHKFTETSYIAWHGIFIPIFTRLALVVYCKREVLRFSCVNKVKVCVGVEAFILIYFVLVVTVSLLI